LEILSFSPVYGDIFWRIWDIGLRPIFNPLVRMANNLTIEDRKKVKYDWILIFCELLSHFLDNYTPDEENAFEFNVVLKKL
jgi:hypothetical protein